MPVVVGGVDLGLLEANAEVKAKLIDAVEEGCLEMLVRTNTEAPHSRNFWSTRLRAKSIGLVSETAVAGLHVEDAAILSSSEEFLDIILEKVSSIPSISDFLLPGATLFVLKETTTATSTTETRTSSTLTSTTTTTTTLPSPEEAAKALLGAVEETSSTLLGALQESNETTVLAALPDGGTLAVSKLGDALADALGSLDLGNLADLGEGGDEGGDGESAAGDLGDSYSSSGSDEGEEVLSVELEVPGTGVNVALPVSMFAALQVKASVAPADVAMVVTSFDPESPKIKGMGKRPDPEEGGVKVEVTGAITIDLRDINAGETLRVKALPQPIKFKLPTNFTPGMKCAFWDEEEQAWSTRGVWAVRANVAGEKITCKTRHLSLFGALLETIIETVACANILNIMNAEAFEELLSGSWLSTPSTAVFGFIFFMLAILLLVAALVDCLRQRRHHFKDEFLLVHNQPALDLGPTSSVRSTAKDYFCGAVCACCLWLQESDVIRQAVDDIASNWFEFFGELRTSIEACVDCMGADFLSAIGAGLTGSRLKDMSHKVTAKTMLFVSRRTVAANLAMTEEMVSFVLDDKDLARFLVNGESFSSGNWRRTPNQRAAFAGLREEVIDCMVRLTVKQGSTRPQFLKTVLMLVVTQNPIGALFVMDIFNSCKQRVFIFSAEMLGALAVSCVFFEASGMAKGKAKSKAKGAGSFCNESDGGVDFVDILGRFMVVSLGCLLVAGLPVYLLSSLQTKQFKVLTSAPGSQAWKRQLRVWRFQERLVMALSLLYMLPLVLYIAMFVANIGDEDHQEWSFMGILTLFQDILLLPFLVALSVPMFAQVLLFLHLHFSGVNRDAFVRAVCELLHDSSNAMLPIERI